MIIYLIAYRPFTSKITNCFNVFNEVVLITTFGLLLLVNVTSISAQVQEIFGWATLLGLLCSLACTWVISAHATVKTVLGKLARKAKKPPAKRVARVKANETQVHVDRISYPPPPERQSLKTAYCKNLDENAETIRKDEKI